MHTALPWNPYVRRGKRCKWPFCDFLWGQILASERTLGTSTHPGGACNEDVGVNEPPESVRPTLIAPSSWSSRGTRMYPLSQSGEATWARPGQPCCLQSGVGSLGQRLPTSFCYLWLPFACANDHNPTFYRIPWLKWNQLTIAAARPEWCRVLMRVPKTKLCLPLLLTFRLKPDSFSGTTCALAASPSGTRTSISWFQTWTQPGSPPTRSSWTSGLSMLSSAPALFCYHCNRDDFIRMVDLEGPALANTLKLVSTLDRDPGVNRLGRSPLHSRDQSKLQPASVT